MVDDTFKEFVLDQLSTLSELRAKAMFGGYGLYSGERFFAILFDGRLYFKVDKTNRAAYLDRDAKPFTYIIKDGRTLAMTYYEVPPEILEDSKELIGWATRSIAIASTSTQKRRSS